MRKFLIVIALTFGLLSSGMAEERPEVSRYAKAYCGGEGVVVWMLRFGPREKREALVQVNGIDHPLDGRILRTSMEMTAGGIKYVTNLNGKIVDILRADDRGMELGLAVERTPVSLRYDPELSAKGSPGAFLTEFLGQE